MAIFYMLISGAVFGAVLHVVAGFFKDKMKGNKNGN